MCLNSIYTKEKQEEVLAKYSTEWVPLLKIVQIKKKKYHPQYYDDKPFKTGLNSIRSFFDSLLKTRPSTIYTLDVTYKAGYHFYPHFLDRSHYFIQSEKLNINEKYITCYAKKSWITAIGEQRNTTVFVTEKAIFPPFGFDTLTDEQIKKFEVIL